MKNKIAHMVNVIEITENSKLSYLDVAQPVTLKTMITARNAASRAVDVELLAIKHKSEQVKIPDGFKWAADFESYAWEHIPELTPVMPHKPLPRLADLFNNFYKASDAEYFIYTNVDIGLYPDFYLYVNDLINKKYDAFCINRRTHPKEIHGVLLDESNIELCYLIEGNTHRGIDCFVFRRDVIPLLTLNHVYLGYPPVGAVLKSQIERNSRNFHWIKNARVTFHLGNDKVWKSSSGPYWEANIAQAKGLY